MANQLCCLETQIARWRHAEWRPLEFVYGLLLGSCGYQTDRKKDLWPKRNRTPLAILERQNYKLAPREQYNGLLTFLALTLPNTNLTNGLLPHPSSLHKIQHCLILRASFTRTRFSLLYSSNCCRNVPSVFSLPSVVKILVTSLYPSSQTLTHRLLPVLLGAIAGIEPPVPKLQKGTGWPTQSKSSSSHTSPPEYRSWIKKNTSTFNLGADQ